MATQLTIQDDMANPTLVAADATGNTFDNGTGLVYFWCKNASGGDITVPVAEQRTCNFGHAAQNYTATVAATTTAVPGPFDIPRFNPSAKPLRVTSSSAPSGPGRPTG